MSWQTVTMVFTEQMEMTELMAKTMVVAEHMQMTELMMMDYDGMDGADADAGTDDEWWGQSRW